MGVPPSQLRGAPTVTSKVISADGRVERTVTASAWTSGDRALLLGLDAYEASLCPGCGLPRERAWHPAMEGWYEVAVLKCQACSTRAQVREEHDDVKPHDFVALHDGYDEAHPEEPLGPLPGINYVDTMDLERAAPVAPPPQDGAMNG